MNCGDGNDSGTADREDSLAACESVTFPPLPPSGGGGGATTGGNGGGTTGGGTTAGGTPPITSLAAFLTRTYLMSRTGYITVRIACPTTAAVSCIETIKIDTASRVIVSARRRILRLATKTVTVARGRSLRLRIRLTPAGRTYVRRRGRRGVRSKLSILSRDRARRVRSASRIVTVRRGF